jgi:Eukaryotic translation initiation factor 3 subunit 8 N-terminus
MSRFWAAGGESSDSDDDDDDKSSNSDDSSDNSSSDSSDDDDDDDDDDDNNNTNTGGIGQTGQQEANRWLAMSDDSSDEDSVRVVLSGKERFHETITSIISSIRKAMKARDYFEIQTLFDTLSKALIKNKQFIVSGVPRPLVRILCDLEDYANERLLDKEQFKTISARQGRALNRFKLTFKKHNRQYQTVMTAYRANPIIDDDDNEGNDTDGDNDDADRKEKAKKVVSDDDDDDDDDDSSSSDSSSSSSNSSDDDDDDDDDGKAKTKVTTTKKKKDDDDDSVSDVLLCLNYYFCFLCLKILIFLVHYSLIMFLFAFI